MLQADAVSHPILRGVKDVWAQSGGYTADPIAGSHVLALGQILNGMTPDSPAAEDKQQVPVAWYRTYQQRVRQAGPRVHDDARRVRGSAERRLPADGGQRELWAAGLEAAIRPDGNISFVGPYQPSTFAFGGFVKGMKPSDMAGWDSPIPKPPSSATRRSA